MGPEFNLVSGVAVRPRATPELIRQGVKIAVETKMNGIMLGFYDGADFPNLRAVRAGLADGGLPVAAAAIQPLNRNGFAAASAAS